MIKRKEFLNLLRRTNFADGMKSGATAYLFISKKKDKNGMSIAKQINMSMWRSFVIAKYKHIPIYIYTLKEIENGDKAVKK